MNFFICLAPNVTAGVALRVAAVIYAYFSQAISATSSHLGIPSKLEKRAGN